VATPMGLQSAFSVNEPGSETCSHKAKHGRAGEI
jgi:hypothetical protein